MSNTITIKIQDLVELALGIRNLDDGSIEQMWFCRPINKPLAELILSHTHNESYCYIQYADEMSPHLKFPLLWELSAWHNHHDKWSREKVRADKDRILRYILEANVKIVAKAFKVYSGVENDDIAQSTAYALVNNNKTAQMRALGVRKLITKEEELI